MRDGDGVRGRRDWVLACGAMFVAWAGAALGATKGSKRVGGTNSHGKGSRYVAPKKAPAKKPAPKTAAPAKEG